MPNFNFDLTLYGGDIGFLPGLEAWITTVIKDSVLRYAFQMPWAAFQSASLVPAAFLGVLSQPAASSAALWISALFLRNAPTVSLTWCQCLCMMALLCGFCVLRHVGLLRLVSKFDVNVTVTVTVTVRTMIITINVITIISSLLSLLLFLCCRPYVLPDHYTIPVVPGDYNAIDKPRGMLFVTIMSAKNVPKMDWFNGSDPYVRYTTKCNYCIFLTGHMPANWSHVLLACDDTCDFVCTPDHLP